MKVLYGSVLVLGVLSTLLALWARRIGSRRWRYRFWLGLVATLAGLWLHLQG